MTIKKHHIIVFVCYTILVVALTYLLANRTTNTNSTGLSNKDQIVVDSLNNRISVLEREQLASDSLITKYKQDIIELDNQIDVTEYKILQIRKDYEKNSINASSYTPTQLDSFFTNRYSK